MLYTKTLSQSRNEQTKTCLEALKIKLFDQHRSFYQSCVFQESVPMGLLTKGLSLQEEEG